MLAALGGVCVLLGVVILLELSIWFVAADLHLIL